MAIRPELSKKNEYRISRHRYYELCHHCLQFNEWVREYRKGVQPTAIAPDGQPTGSGTGDPTARNGEEKAELRIKIDRIRATAKEAAGEVLAPYLLEAVTNEGIGYDYLRDIRHIPCGKNAYYRIYHRFYWMLDKIVE